MTINTIMKLLPRGLIASKKNFPGLSLKTTPKATFNPQTRKISTSCDTKSAFLLGGSVGGRNGGILAKLFAKSQSPQILLGGGQRCYSDWNGLPGQDKVNFLTDKNIDSVIRSSGSLLIMYYAPWCGHCRSSKPEYAKAGQMLATERPSAQLAAINCMIYPAIYEKYEIVGYPTFKYYNAGRLIGEYHHRRKASDFVHFMLREPKNRDDL